MLLPFLTALNASAQWNGIDYEQPQGGGVADNPYLISRPEHLEWIRVQKSDFNNKYFLMVADIDLNGQEWKVIQAATGSNAAGFRGHFLGNGHTISNCKIYWNNTSSSFGFGLFAYVQIGEVRDLNIKNVTVTRTANGNLRTSNNDVKIGILTGALGPKCTITNINIINCRIDDGNGAVASGEPFAVYAGGLAGDIAERFGGSQELSEANAPKISNIVAHVDIDLSNTTRFTGSDQGTNASNKLPQFNVGGIIGRLRRIPKVGTNLMFTGSIKAPIASVGPIYSLVRYNNENDILSLAKAYAGEKNASGTPLFADHASLPDDMFYYDYRVWNPVAATLGFEDISNTYPPVEPTGSTALAHSAPTTTTRCSPLTT